MATRYEGENGEPDLKVVDYLPAKGDKSPVHGKLSILLIWNKRDTVDSFERHRNDVIYSYQHNRNPFIDHPEFVNSIWGSDSVVSGIVNLQAQLIDIYPNPASGILHFNHAENMTKVLFTLEGSILRLSTSSSMDLDDLSSGMYMVVFKDREGRIVRRMKVVKQ